MLCCVLVGADSIVCCGICCCVVQCSVFGADSVCDVVDYSAVCMSRLFRAPCCAHDAGNAFGARAFHIMFKCVECLHAFD